MSQYGNCPTCGSSTVRKLIERNERTGIFEVVCAARCGWHTQVCKIFYRQPATVPTSEEDSKKRRWWDD